jgi:predicted nuclease of predicted toxin-antitoxin system
MRSLTSELASHVAKGATAPRVYADANLPVGLVAFMRTTLGWDVFFVMEHHDLRRAPDERHYALAREMRRTLVSLDRDYTDDRRFPPESSGGVIVIHAPDAPRYEALLRRVDRRLLRPDHPDTLLPADASFDQPLAGRKLCAYSDWP